MSDRGFLFTLQDIRRQLAGMPNDFCLVKFTDLPTSRLQGERLWTADELARATVVRFLRARNRQVFHSRRLRGQSLSIMVNDCPAGGIGAADVTTTLEGSSARNSTSDSIIMGENKGPAWLILLSLSVLGFR